MNTQVILASQSIGRKTLLEKLGVPFITQPADLDEDAITSPDPLETIRLRARAKATHILNTGRLTTYNLPAQAGAQLIIAADTMVIYNGKLYSKPIDQDDARRLLKDLVGNTHIAATHTVILQIENGKETRRWEKTTETKMTMNPLSDTQLEAYISRYDLTRFAGCYSLDEAPWDLFSKIDGSYTNVIGLPFEVILPIFTELTLLSQLYKSLQINLQFNIFL